MFFYLIRHGAKAPTRGDPPLSLLGHEQAELTGQHLTGQPVTALLSSPQRRAAQTAQIIGARLVLAPITNDALRERLNWGTWAHYHNSATGESPDEPFEDFLELWRYTSLHRDYTPPVGDSSRAAGTRLHRVLTTLSVDPATAKGMVVLVSHGGTIADFLRNVLTPAQLEELWPGFAHALEAAIAECSITSGFVMSDGQIVISQIGSTTHLQSVPNR